MHRTTRWTYSDGNTCPLCREPITNYAKFCRECWQLFRSWFYDIYGYFPPARKRNRTRRGIGGMSGQGVETRERILAVLKDGPKSVMQLAQHLKMTCNGIRFHIEVLRKEKKIENVGSDYKAL